MGRAATLIKGSMFRTAALLVNIVAVFMLVPFMVKVLGDDMYGLWVIIGTMTGYYFLIDFGISQAVARYVAKAIGADKKGDIDVTVSNAVFIFGILSLLALAVTVGVIFSLPHFISGPMLGIAQMLVLLVGVEFAISLPLRPYLGVLTGNMDFDVISVFEIVKTIFRTITIYLVLSAGYGIIALGLTNMVFNLLYLFTAYLFSKARYKVRFQRKLVRRAECRKLFDFSKYVFLNSIADLLRFRLSQFIIGVYLSLAFVTVYSIAARIMDYFMQVIIRILGVLEPLFSQLHGAKDEKAIREKYLLASRISVVITFIIGGNIILFGKAFILLWMGEEYVGAYPALVVLTIGMTVALSQSVGLSVLRAIKKHNYSAIMSVVEGVLNLILTLVLVKKYGIFGVALGLTIPMLVIKVFVQPYLVARFIKLDLRKYFGTILPAILFLVAGFMGLHFLGLMPGTYTSLILTAVGVNILLGGLLYILIIRKEEKEYFKGLIRGGLHG